MGIHLDPNVSGRRQWRMAVQRQGLDAKPRIL
ncbi:hypothetical protein CBM2589_B30072 [Cupriavidus taiwanensis]|uniref:Uncharacterized protein n=1 Tax=Cupriavidus taiwanensis TaxID=164546 RepID=A0A375BUG4_9BURK|nr:hypothetical protein CBM2589_B30072 [Cupriavidus taiwanensis]